MNQQILDLIRYATLAPSGHNTQPWKFAVKDSVIRIFPDFTRKLSAVDPDCRELFISLGCALENLVIAAHHAGFDSEIAYFPVGEPKDCILVHLHQATPYRDKSLFSAIPSRQNTRNHYNKAQVPAEHLKKLDGYHKENGVNSLIIIHQRQIEALAEYIREGDKKQFTQKDFVRELKNWMRFNRHEAQRTLDGLSSQCLGNPDVPRWLGEFAMSYIVSGKTQGKKDANLTLSSSGVAVFFSDSNDKKSWVEIGRTYERFALTATSLNIKTAFMNQPNEIPELRTQLQSYLGLKGKWPQLLLRFGYAQPMPKSLRRPLEEVLIR